MSTFFKLGRQFGEGFCSALLDCQPLPHHDPIVSQHLGFPRFTVGGIPLAQALSLPFDSIATITPLATRQSGQITNILPGSTVTSDNPAVAVNQFPDGSYTLTATAQTGAANVSLTPPPGSTVPVDVAVVTIVDDPIVSQSLDTENATFSVNPNPPTA